MASLSQASESASNPSLLSPLSIQNLVKVYPGGNRAVNDVSFEMKPGEILGLLGPNGAGKTTIISTIVTLEEPTSGTAKVFGLDVAKDPQKAKSITGFVPQELIHHGFFDVNEIIHWAPLPDPEAEYRGMSWITPVIREVMGDTGMTLHPELVAFLEAQQAQAPFWVDTGFLTIKHVDEIASFLTGADGRPRMLFADTRSAAELAPHSDGPSNHANQERLDKVLHGGTYPSGETNPGLLTQLGLTEDQVVRLPVSYDGGHNVWSNPVNSLHLNGLVVTGDSHVPPAVAGNIRSQLLAAGARDVRFVDDEVYQDRCGNVHCATNTLRLPG